MKLAANQNIKTGIALATTISATGDKKMKAKIKKPEKKHWQAESSRQFAVIAKYAQKTGIVWAVPVKSACEIWG